MLAEPEPAGPRARRLQHAVRAPRDAFEERGGGPGEADEVVTAVLRRSQHHVGRALRQDPRGFREISARQGGQVAADEKRRRVPVGQQPPHELGHARAEISVSLRDEAQTRRRQRRHGAQRSRRAIGEHGGQAGQRGRRLQAVEEEAAVEEGGRRDAQRGVEPRLHRLRSRRPRHHGQRRETSHRAVSLRWCGRRTRR
jgi:hypothetical protein